MITFYLQYESFYLGHSTVLIPVHDIQEIKINQNASKVLPSGVYVLIIQYNTFEIWSEIYRVRHRNSATYNLQR